MSMRCPRFTARVAARPTTRAALGLLGSLVLSAGCATNSAASARPAAGPAQAAARALPAPVDTCQTADLVGPGQLVGALDRTEGDRGGGKGVVTFASDDKPGLSHWFVPAGQPFVWHTLHKKPDPMLLGVLAMLSAQGGRADLPDGPVLLARTERELVGELWVTTVGHVTCGDVRYPVRTVVPGAMPTEGRGAAIFRTRIALPLDAPDNPINAWTPVLARLVAGMADR